MESHPSTLVGLLDALRANAVAGELLSQYLELVNAWRDCEHAMERLDFEGAVRLTWRIDELSSFVIHSAVAVRDLLTPVRCASGGGLLALLPSYLDPDESAHLHVLSLAVAAVVLIVIGVRKRRSPGVAYAKPKLN